MTQWIEVAPPHSLILIVGSKNADIPQSFSGKLIATTSSCIAIGCKSEDDGPSRLALEAANSALRSVGPTFIARLDTPEGVVAIETVFGERIAEHKAPCPKANILIWVNDDTEPDEIVIAVEG